MSVYKPKKSPYYQFDFQLQGRRFHGSTGLSNKRAAERYEEAQKEAAKADLEQEARTGSEPMTFDLAAGRYWAEVGQHHAGEGAKNTKRALAWLVKEIGQHTRIADLSDNVVSELVARRRGQKARNSDRQVSNATVNRSCTEPLRKVLSRAEDMPRISGVRPSRTFAGPGIS
jgi:hypothetical protein